MLAGCGPSVDVVDDRKPRTKPANPEPPPKPPEKPVTAGGANWSGR